MSGFLLDTNIPSELIHSRPDQIAQSLIPAFSGRILPVTQAIAERWGEIGAAAQQHGASLKIADGLVAASALDHGLVLATRNTRDFTALPVNLHNPWG